MSVCTYPPSLLYCFLKTVFDYHVTCPCHALICRMNVFIYFVLSHAVKRECYGLLVHLSFGLELLLNNDVHSCCCKTFVFGCHDYHYLDISIVESLY
jgi:hypothetical protein